MAVRLLGSPFKHILEFGDGLLAHVDILVGRRAGNVLAGVCGGQIEAGVGQIRIQILRLLEVFNREIELTSPEGLHALVQLVARSKLVATCRRNHG